MKFWTEIHWSEGMFLRPHHLQAAQRRADTIVNSSFDALRPFGWGFVHLNIATEPLENYTLRLDECGARFADGTWVQVPDNTDVAPLDFQDALESADGPLDIYFGIPQMQEVRANSVSLERPGMTSGTPRYEPSAVVRRDENTGENPQTMYIRRIRGRLFVAGADMTGYETMRLGSVARTDRPGAVPELEAMGAGPTLSVQCHAGLSRVITSLADQLEAKDEVLAREAREHAMNFSDGVPSNLEHLFKLHALNEVRAQFRALLQCPVLHPYDVYVLLSRLVGHLSVFHTDLVPGSLPEYEHDRPGVCISQLRARIELLLNAMRPMNYVERKFARKRDARGQEGLEVELDRSWIDENLEMFVSLTSAELDIEETERYVKSRLNLKLASPTRAPRIANIAVQGLRLQVKSVPAGTLPRRAGLHYFRIDKTIGADRTDFWRECEQEHGIRVSIQEGQMADFEKFQPTLYVILKSRP